MTKVHFIAMDTHGKTTDICCKTAVKGPAKTWHVRTTIPALREVIESIRRPRQLCFEEGPLADWLYRNLKPVVDELMVCDPRRNAWIARDGDKDDPIDARKLCDLQMGGYLRAVHHSDSLQRVIFKRQVALYHERVEHRVAEANKIIGFLKGWGLIVRQKDFAASGDRQEILRGLGGDEGPMQAVQQSLKLLWKGYDLAVEQETQLHRELEKSARQEELIQRLMQLPGVGCVRAATLVAYLDTPWRFAGKQALWKYMGIGLVREKSGAGRASLRVENACNRRLKSAILGAAASAILQKDNPFAEQYERWRTAGLSLKNARRNVGRSMAAVMWGMWKNGGVYDPERVMAGGRR